MAKQIYIDENGNEILVSGTIINAGNLPLGSDFSDPTSTAYAINGINSRLGTRLVGDWTADSSTGNATRLTDSITCTAGTYLITMSYPNIDTTQFVAGLFREANWSIYDNAYMIGGSLTEHTIITAFSDTQKVFIASAQGASCAFTNKSRGSIRAVKLSGNY